MKSLGDHDYNIFKLEECTEVKLIGTHNSVLVMNPLFKLSRYSISEGIFESKLAERAQCSLSDGNTYELRVAHDQCMYIQCTGTWAYFGTTIAH